MPEKTQVVRIDANLSLACYRTGAGRWIGVCESLKITLQGDTWGDLIDEFRETLDAILGDLLAGNELRGFLRDKGWIAMGRLPVHDGRTRFDVPFQPFVIPVPANKNAHARPVS